MKRLLEDSGSELARQVLRSAREDVPSAATQRRVAAALGIAVPAAFVAAEVAAVAGHVPASVASASGAAGAGATGVSALPLLTLPAIVKAGAVALAVGVVVTTGLIVTAPRAKTPPRFAAVVGSVQPPAATLSQIGPRVMGPTPSAAPTPSPSTHEPAPVAARPEFTFEPAPTITGGRTGKSSEPASIAAEMAFLDGARSSLKNGDPSAALSAANVYAVRFPNGTLLPEATMLHLDALVVTGDRSRAADEASRFLTASPNTPYARRLRAIIASSRTNP